MLDITTMLHQVINLELKVDEEKELLLGPEVRQQTIFVDLDLALARTAESVGWYRVVEPVSVDHEALLKNYAEAVALFLLFSAKMQWTHLVVLDDEAWQRIAGSQRATNLADLNKAYLAVKHFLTDAYFNHQQEAFRHAWHLLLKLGMVDWQLSVAEINTAYQRLMEG